MKFGIKPKHLVRLAAVLMVIHTVGHTIGTLNWKSNSNEDVRLVIQGMETKHFEFIGRSATLGKFYEGYGLTMILVLLLISLQLWILSNEIEGRKVKGLLIALSVFLVLMAGLEYIYFFSFAATISFVAGICVILALMARTRSKVQSI